MTLWHLVAGPWVRLPLLEQVRGQLLDQRRPARHRERGRDTDVLKGAGAVVQPEHQAPDDGSGLVQPVAGNHDVGGAHVLDLQHRPLVLLVGRPARLGDDAVQPGALKESEPVASEGRVVGGRGQVNRGGGFGQGLLEQGPSLLLRSARQVLRSQGQQVKGDEGRRGPLGQQLHSGGGRVDALEQRLEVQALAVGDDDLAVDDAALGKLGLHSFDDLGEVAGQRFFVAAAELHLVTVAKDDAPETIPLRLVEEVTVGNLGNALGQHRLHGRHNGQLHAQTTHLASQAAVRPSRRSISVITLREEKSCTSGSG